MRKEYILYPYSVGVISQNGCGHQSSIYNCIETLVSA